MRGAKGGAVALLLAAALAAGGAQAEWRVHRGANVRFDVPTGWMMQTQPNAMLIYPQQGGVGVQFVALTNPATNAAVEAELMASVRAQFTQMQITRPARPITQNGLAGVAVRGVGIRQGRLMEWFALALGAGGRGVAAIGFAQPGQIDGNAELMHVLNTIGPAV